jgi:hypothetical protein
MKLTLPISGFCCASPGMFPFIPLKDVAMGSDQSLLCSYSHHYYTGHVLIDHRRINEEPDSSESHKGDDFSH